MFTCFTWKFDTDTDAPTNENVKILPNLSYQNQDLLHLFGLVHLDWHVFKPKRH